MFSGFGWRVNKIKKIKKPKFKVGSCLKG